MLNSKTVFESQPVWQQALIVLVFNTLIALFLHAILSNSTFSNQVIFSQAIGFSIFLCYLVFGYFFILKGWRMLLPLSFGSLIGVTIAITIQALSVDATFQLVMKELQQNYLSVLTTLFIGLFFGAIVVGFFVSREKLLKTKQTLQAEKIHNLNHQKTIAETHLRMLQAQIEPHFLFNTLSNVISLIDQAPQKSIQLLEALTEFLRVSLKRSTDTRQTLGNELSLIGHYLAIMKIRLGDRLEYHIHAQDEEIDIDFPQLLLQPLVENAVIHGIEPLAAGGQIDISTSIQDNVLQIRVADTGKGLADSRNKGFGLRNIRDRLQSIYGDKGRMQIQQNNPSGVVAILEVPYAPG